MWRSEAANNKRRVQLIHKPMHMSLIKQKKVKKTMAIQNLYVLIAIEMNENSVCK